MGEKGGEERRQVRERERWRQQELKKREGRWRVNEREEVEMEKMEAR